ncbi:hypothetical protein F7725_009757 [Dissostichus mawsoni]|uniref:Probable RNA-binding protein EIF1AD n=1 Tax=Dissostichus mawsoni TaxID=36200 RepID=A0A7J5XN59_DISMA|nr:hypothetical protein F7725_009757 [Dissostichus mawsoni]
MSQATKRKHVVKEVLGDFVTPTENQQIVKVTGSRGNNLHEAVTAQGVTFLVSMPPKFRKNLWIKRGDYVIVDPIEEGEKPEGFTEEPLEPEKTKKGQEKREDTEDKDEEDFSDSEDDESDLFVNTNRNNYQYIESEEEDSDEEEEDGKEKRTENGS